MTERERSMALITAWIHEDTEAILQTLPQTAEEGYRQTADLAVVASALLINWAREIGLDPKELLSDLAIGQALEATTR